MWKWHSWFANAAIVVVVKVVQGRLLDTLLSQTIVEVRAIVIKRVKILRNTAHQSLEAGVRFGTGSVKAAKDRQSGCSAIMSFVKE